MKCMESQRVLSGTWPLWRLHLFYLRAAFPAVTGQFLLLEGTAYTFAFGLVLHGVPAGVDDRGRWM